MNNVTITFTDGTSEMAELGQQEWEELDDLLASGFSAPWIRFTGDDLARWYRTETIRSIEAL